MSTEPYIQAMINIDLIDIIDQPITEQTEVVKALIGETIKEKGMFYEIYVQKQPNGRFVVVDGRTRLEKARELGDKYIACKYKEDDPYAHEWAYELELARRSLTPEERIAVEKRYQDIKNSNISTMKENVSKKLSPEMRAIYQSMSDKGTLTKEWNTLFWLLAKRPWSEQKAFFETNTDKVPADNTDDNSIPPEIVEELQNKIEELEQETKRLKKEEQDMKKSEERMKQAIKARFDEEIKIREAKIRQEMQEAIKENSQSGAKYEAHLEQIRKEMTEKYEAEMSEMNQKMRNLSKAKQETQKELDVLKIQMETTATKSKNYELILKRKAEEVERDKKVISTLANTPRIVKQIEAMQIGMDQILEAIKYLPDNVITNTCKNDIQMMANKIIDITNKITEMAEEKAQKAIKTEAA